MLTAYYKSTGTLTATLTNESGVAVTGATLTVTIARSGKALTGVAWPVTMTEAGGGAYTYTVPATLLALNATYVAQITAIRAGVQRYAEVLISCVVDDD